MQLIQILMKTIMHRGGSLITNTGLVIFKKMEQQWFLPQEGEYL
jgi:hypothetical protein